MLKPLEPSAKDYVGPISDSRRWGAFEPRPGDIVVTTPPKSGTTWTQGILAMLIAGDPGVDAQTTMKSPWIDMSMRPLDEVMGRLQAQDHRRQVKSHTPFDGLPYWSELRYLTVYRHPIDVHFSYREHLKNMQIDVYTDLFPEDPRESFRIFVEGDHYEGASLWGIATHFKSTRARLERENLIMLHYADMQRDLPGSVSRIAAHVGLVQTPDLMQAIVDGARFESMQQNADRFAPSAGQGLWARDADFFHSATSNKWLGRLTDDDLAAYDAAIDKLLPPEERRWLEWGGTMP